MWDRDKETRQSDSNAAYGRVQSSESVTLLSILLFTLHFPPVMLLTYCIHQ